MRILVCGGRDYQDSHLLNEVLARYPITTIIHGDARGADRLAALYAMQNHISHAPFPANWLKHGKSAGPIRNRQMLTEGNPDLVIAFPGGKGTANMVMQAKAAGITVVEITA